MANKPRLLVIEREEHLAPTTRALLAEQFDLVVSRTPADALVLLREQEFVGVYLESAQRSAVQWAGLLIHPEAILASIADGVAVVDQDRRILWANPEFLSMGAAPVAAINSEFYQALGNPEVILGAPCPFASAVTSRTRASAVLRLATARYLQVTVTPIVDAKKSQTQLIVATHDITEETQQEQKIKAIHKACDELSDLTPEELAELGVEERTELLKFNIIRHMKDLLGLDWIEIRLLDRQSGRLVPLLAQGMTATAASRELFARKENNGITGFVAATGQSYVCPDTIHDPLYLEGASGARSALTVRLIDHGMVIGTLNVENARPNAFDERDCLLLEIYGRSVASALNTLELLHAESVRAATASVESISRALALPLDDILSDATTVLDRYAGRDDEIIARLRHVVFRAREIRGLAERVGSTNVSEPQQNAPRPVSRLAGLRLLVVDADETIRRSAHKLLGDQGASVETARDAHEAIALTRHTPYSAALVDIRLPDLDGYETLKQLREVQPGLPIILMTGFGWDPTRSIVKARHEGEQIVLYKPFRTDRLMEAVKQALPSPTASPHDENTGVLREPANSSIGQHPDQAGERRSEPTSVLEEAGSARTNDSSTAPKPLLDEDVQFTVYRPQVVRPEEWYPLLVFAHLSQRPPDAPADAPDPVEEVQRQARHVLAEQINEYKYVAQDSASAIPRAGELTVLPELPGFEFNPLSRVFRWLETVHREEFRVRASGALHGRTVRGRISVFWGSILLADIPLAIRVDREHQTAPHPETGGQEQARPYRKIFVSYSHKDLEIVRQVEQFANLIGDQYLRDWTHLRAGENWNQRLGELIAEADVFQLFWSRNSMRSDYVRREWEHALSLRRPNFLRPSYWEDPFPHSDDPPLPPDGLKELHFQRLSIVIPTEKSPCRDPSPSTPVPPSDSTPSDPAAGRSDSTRDPASQQSTTPASSLPEESTLGPYRVTGALGRGDRRRVFHGCHRATGQEVVIKVLDGGARDSALLAELPSFARLRHPQIVRVIDALVESDRPYLVRDYVEGRTLEDWKNEQRRTPVEAAAMVLALAAPMIEAHDRGFVHRDLTLSKVVVDRQGTPLLMADHFVRELGGGAQANLPSENLCGSLIYMAPERVARPPEHDRRSDVYAMGMILFELLTNGQFPHPWDGRDTGRLSTLIAEAAPHAPSDFTPEVPRALDAICLVCLDKDAGRRYATMAALAAALRAAAQK